MVREISEIINKWNPIEIFPLLEDEYFQEAKEIAYWIRKNDSFEIYELVEYIDKVFIEYFGSDLYRENTEECWGIAKQIQKKIANV